MDDDDMIAEIQRRKAERQARRSKPTAEQPPAEQSPKPQSPDATIETEPTTVPAPPHRSRPPPSSYLPNRLPRHLNHRSNPLRKLSSRTTPRPKHRPRLRRQH